MLAVGSRKGVRVDGDATGRPFLFAAVDLVVVALGLCEQSPLVAVQVKCICL